MDEVGERVVETNQEVVDSGLDAQGGLRLQVLNLPHHLGFKEFKQLIGKKLALDAKKIRQLKDCAYLTFGSASALEHAEKILDGYTIKGRKLGARRAFDQPNVRRVQVKSSENEQDSAPKDVRDIVTPLWATPYEEQLQIKQNDTETTFRGLVKLLEQANCQSTSTLVPSEIIQPIKASPKIEAYRNKCEFTVGKDIQGSTIVGFVGGKYVAGKHYVLPVHECTHISSQVKNIVSRFEKFISASGYPAFDEETRSGYWKMLTVREFLFDVLIIVTACPMENEEITKVAELKRTLSGEFLNVDNMIGEKPFRVTSVYWSSQQNFGDIISYEHIGGAPYVNETLLGCRFRVSPGAFFQTNTAGAEVLYETIGQAAGIDDTTVVLDICCGTGTIGICLAAKKARACFGVEIVKEAVEDAKINAKTNGFKEDRCKFVYGKAENVINDLKYLLPSTVDNYESANFLGILDPPRAGVHPKLLIWVRKFSRLRKLVYVSCDPKAACKNFVDFCRPMSNRFEGEPFRLKSICPVDMFPQTRHCEWVILFER